MHILPSGLVDVALVPKLCVGERPLSISLAGLALDVVCVDGFYLQTVPCLPTT
jgi:hypothetical protein